MLYSTLLIRERLRTPFRLRPQLAVKWNRIRTCLYTIVLLRLFLKQHIAYGIYNINPLYVEQHYQNQTIKNNAKNAESHSASLRCCRRYCPCCRLCPLINPDGKFFSIWDKVIICFLLYTIIIMPFYVAFLYETESDNQAWMYIDLMADLVFCSDIIINLHLPYDDSKGRRVTERSKIFFRYLKGWFVVDVISAIPLDFLFRLLSQTAQASIGNNLLRFLRIGRLYKLVKITRVVGIFKRGKKNLFARCREFFKLNTGCVRFAWFLYSTLMFVHLTGCLWFYIARLENFNEHTWVFRASLNQSDNFTLYITSIYWAFQTLLTVGYGDLPAYTAAELVMSILWMMVGAGFYTFTIGTLTSVVYNRDSRKNHLNNRLNNIDTFCKHINIQKRLRDKLKKTVKFSSQRKIAWFVKLKIFHQLPQNIKSEIAKKMDDGLVDRLIFFRDKEASFIGTIIPLLVPQDVAPGELIYKIGDHSNSMFFIKRGSVSYVLTYLERIYQELNAGSHFGEVSILLSDRRNNTVVTCEQCVLFSLTKRAVEGIIRTEYPDIYQDMIEEAKKKSIRMATRKRIAVHEAVRTYILCKCPSLDNFNDDQTEGQSPKFKRSLSHFARAGGSQGGDSHRNLHSPKHNHKHPRTMFQYSRFTPYEFSKMVTYCVQREVNIGNEGEVIPEEELIELVQSCDQLQNSPVYRKMKEYQNIGKLEPIEDDEEQQRYSFRAASHKLENKTEDNLGSIHQINNLPALKRGVNLKHTLTNSTITPLKLPGLDRKKVLKKQDEIAESVQWQQKRLNILSIAKLLSTSESQRLREQRFIKRVESGEEPPQIIEKKIGLEFSSHSQSFGSLHQQVSIGEVLKEQKRKYQRTKVGSTGDGIKFFPVETLDSKFNEPDMTGQSDEQPSSFFDFTHLSEIRESSHSVKLNNTYKKSATAKDQNLTGRKWGSSRRKIRKILKQKTFSPKSRKSPDVKNLHSKIKYEHSKTLVMGKKIDEMETNCAGLIEKVKDLLESPGEQTERRSSQ